MNAGRHAHQRTRSAAGAMSAATLLLAAATAAALAGTGTSLAYFSDTATVDAGTLTAGSITATAALAPSLSGTYTVEAGEKVGTLRISNTGTVPATFTTSAALTPGSSAGLGEHVTVAAWKKSQQESGCEARGTTESPTPGTWSSFQLTGSLAPQESVDYCLRTVLTALDAPAGTISPVFTTTLAAGSWSSGSVVSAEQAFAGAPSAPLTPEQADAPAESPATAANAVAETPPAEVGSARAASVPEEPDRSAPAEAESFQPGADEQAVSSEPVVEPDPHVDDPGSDAVEAASDPEPDPEPEAAPEPTLEPVPEPAPKPEAAPEPAPEPEPSPKPGPVLLQQCLAPKPEEEAVPDEDAPVDAVTRSHVPAESDPAVANARQEEPAESEVDDACT